MMQGNIQKRAFLFELEQTIEEVKSQITMLAQNQPEEAKEAIPDKRVLWKKLAEAFRDYDMAGLSATKIYLTWYPAFWKKKKAILSTVLPKLLFWKMLTTDKRFCTGMKSLK